jgi:hypothetical protein
VCQSIYSAPARVDFYCVRCDLLAGLPGYHVTSVKVTEVGVGTRRGLMVVA